MRKSTNKYYDSANPKDESGKLTRQDYIQRFLVIMIIVGLLGLALYFTR